MKASVRLGYIIIENLHGETHLISRTALVKAGGGPAGKRYPLPVYSDEQAHNAIVAWCYTAQRKVVFDIDKRNPEQLVYVVEFDPGTMPDKEATALTNGETPGFYVIDLHLSEINQSVADMRYKEKKQNRCTIMEHSDLANAQALLEDEEPTLQD